jgi:DNA mismatch repair protein MutL
VGTLVSRAPERPATPLAAHRYLGQALATYLLLEAPGRIVLLDQHAAHERVLFERMRQTALEGKLERQALLLPLRIELPRSAADALEQHAEALAGAGFELESEPGALRGGSRLVLRTVPALLSSRADQDWARMLEETASALAEPEQQASRDGIDGALHGILASAACHSAVRKGDRLTPEEVQGLLEALDETVWFPNCPHGRPILVELAESELERRFARR